LFSKKRGGKVKICKHKVTDRILETQFGKDAEVLIRNNKQYYPETDIEVVDMTRGEYETAIKVQNFNDLDYRQKRAREYPPATDYLDGIVKDDQAQIQKYIDDCKAVKAKYPKP
jgi:hypothetical protein